MNKSELFSQSWNLRRGLISGILVAKLEQNGTSKDGQDCTIKGYNENEIKRSRYFLLGWMHWFNCGFCISWLPSIKSKCHFFADIWILCKGVQIPLIRHNHWHHEPHSWKHQEKEAFAPTEQDYCNNPHHSLISWGLCGHYMSLLQAGPCG